MFRPELERDEVGSLSTDQLKTLWKGFRRDELLWAVLLGPMSTYFVVIALYVGKLDIFGICIILFGIVTLYRDMSDKAFIVSEVQRRRKAP